MNKYYLAAWVWLLALVQGYFFSALAANLAAVPNIMPLLLIAIVIGYTPRLAFAMALWAGFWIDLASNIHFGAATIYYGLLFIFLNTLKRQGVDFTKKLNVIAVTTVVIFLQNFWYIALASVETQTWLGNSGLWRYWVLEVIITSVSVLLIWRLLLKLVVRQQEGSIV